MDQVVVQFDTIDAFLGDEAIKQTLYFVNKQLFQLSANQIHKSLAKYLYKINGFEWNQNTFLSITHLNITHLKIDREDLYGLSLLNGITTFRTGLVEYGKLDRITIYDITRCFSNWTKLVTLDLWHIMMMLVRDIMEIQ
eukprot:1120859_1